jgi:hypothetical protein
MRIDGVLEAPRFREVHVVSCKYSQRRVSSAVLAAKTGFVSG